VAAGRHADERHRVQLAGLAADDARRRVRAVPLLTIRDRHTWFGRAEIVEKPAEDLHVHESPTRIFTVAKLQGGYVRYFKRSENMMAGIGGTISGAFVPAELASRYFGRVAPGFGVFLLVHPAGHRGSHR
jgi:hypothetical protein